jgi:hypothetical protein
MAASSSSSAGTGAATLSGRMTGNLVVLAALTRLRQGELFALARRSHDPIHAPSRYAPRITPKGKVPASRDFEDGSDGTRTRDLRRDRPAF